MSLLLLSVVDAVVPPPPGASLVHGSEEWAVEIISQQFLDRWPVEAPGVAYGMEDEPQSSSDAFVSLMIRHTDTARGGQITQGEHPRVMRTGRLWVKVWTPAIAIVPAVGGTKARAQLHDAARRVFERAQLGDPLLDQLQIETGTTQEAGSDGRWMISAVVFAFRYTQQQ